MIRHPKLRGHGLRPAQNYSPQEIARALGVAETTVRTWIRAGKLPALTNGNPQLVLGSDAQAFFKAFRKPTESMQEGQFRCMHCRVGRNPLGAMVDFCQKPGAQTGLLKALCEVCGSTMSRGVSIRDLPRLQTIYDFGSPVRAGN
jgi:excisionase family DNA binding protein